jgi:hypothetical protein
LQGGDEVIMARCNIGRCLVLLTREKKLTIGSRIGLSSNSN